MSCWDAEGRKDERKLYFEGGKTGLGQDTATTSPLRVEPTKRGKGHSARQYNTKVFIHFTKTSTHLVEFSKKQLEKN